MLIRQDGRYTPEQKLIIAVFFQAARDLCSKFTKWRLDAVDFFKSDGYTDEQIKIIKELIEDDL
jgi:hypothetical protein